jgi:gliding motility-associated-like protein
MKKSYLLYLLLLLQPTLSKAQNPTLEFVRNEGQWSGDFLYRSLSGTAGVFLQQQSVTYLLAEPGSVDKIDAFKHGHTAVNPVIKQHAYRVSFENSRKPAVKEQKALAHYYNYFLGKDPAHWKSRIHPCLAVDYTELYEGINVHFSSESGNLKYDFIVQPQADASQIKLKIEGANKLSLKKGNLIIGTSVGDIQESKPFVYQYINDQRRDIACNYILKGDVLSFEFPEGYDHNEALVIDPTVVFATFTGSTSDNWGFTATYDPAGNLYAGGLVSGTGFPVGLGAFQTTYKGGSSSTGSFYPCDMGIIKFNATGTTKIYATYIGGSDNDQPHSMIVDADNNLIIAGRTYSSDYPVLTPAADASYNGKADLVVTKLNADGTALLGSTFLGGSGDDCVNYNADEYKFGGLKHNYGDDARSEVLVDRSGNVYVTTSTFSDDFPTMNPIQSARAGGQDAVLVKLNANLSALLFSTYLGGSSDDAGYVLGLNKAQNEIFMAGGTQSSNFPSTSGTYQPGFLGGTDGYILRISNGPSYTIARGTFIGTSNYDQVYGLQLDANDDVYVMGQTLGGTFPVSAGVYSNANSSQFVMKLNNNLSAPIYSTVFGSGNSAKTNISPVAFLVDTCENVYISGWGGNLSISTVPATIGTTTGMPVSSTAIQPTTDGADFYFIVLGKNANSLLYATFFGRNSSDARYGEHVDGGTSRFDKSGIVYQAICGGCFGTGPAVTAFPTTAGSYSPLNPSPNCNLAALKIEFDLSAVKADAEVYPSAKGCPPLTVNFTNKSKNATTYTWNFADGTPESNLKEPTHTFYTPGKYKVRMVAHNPNACIEYDTSYLNISVDSNGIRPGFEFTVQDSCKKPFKVSFVNTSTPGANPPSYIWSFGDGTSFSGTNPPVHEYSTDGAFFVTLTMIDTGACNSPDTFRNTVYIENKFLKAAADIPDALCSRAGGILLKNTSSNAQRVFWDFGDGTTSTETSPMHVFDTGVHQIMLVVYNDNSCNPSDTIRKKITVRPGATANFIYQPTLPNPNDSIKYTNMSKDALKYLWMFGDGATTTVEHPSHMFKKTNTYKTCLVAYGYQGCNDTLCKMVKAIIVPAVDVPTGFSPNGDGINDVLYVKGAALTAVELKIFNRWGQLVFETTTAEVGWNGTFNGAPQPMESYAYVLNATFIDGSTVTKKGNITQLR